MPKLSKITNIINTRTFQLAQHIHTRPIIGTGLIPTHYENSNWSPCASYDIFDAPGVETASRQCPDLGNTTCCSVSKFQTRTLSQVPGKCQIPSVRSLASTRTAHIAMVQPTLFLLLKVIKIKYWWKLTSRDRKSHERDRLLIVSHFSPFSSGGSF